MIAYLSVTNYDMAGGIHYYGRIKLGKEEINVEYTLTVAGCRALNKDDRRRGDQITYRPGSTTTRFRSEAALIKAAVTKAQELGITILIRGHSYVLEPQEVIFGPEPFKTQMNKLYAEGEANNWWEGDNKIMERIENDYQALMKQVA